MGNCECARIHLKKSHQIPLVRSGEQMTHIRTKAGETKTPIQATFQKYHVCHFVPLFAFVSPLRSVILLCRFRMYVCLQCLPPQIQFKLLSNILCRFGFASLFFSLFPFSCAVASAALCVMFLLSFFLIHFLLRLLLIIVFQYGIFYFQVVLAKQKFKSYTCIPIFPNCMDIIVVYCQSLLLLLAVSDPISKLFNVFMWVSACLHIDFLCGWQNKINGIRNL